MGREYSDGGSSTEMGLSLLLLLTAAQAAATAPTPALSCPMDEVLAALSGVGPAPHPAVLTPPAALGAPPAEAPPPGAAKAVYGTNYTYHHETDNFTINWASNPGISDALVTSAAEALEASWAAMVVDGGWDAPVSSDRFYLWVVLDRSLGSTTGITTEYTTALYPQGYPVIFLNPDYAWDDAFWRSLAAPDDETWFWEASAQWTIEEVLPDLDVYAREATRYASYPWYRYASTDDYHQYGMMVLNAWATEALGASATRLAWESGRDNNTETWDAVLEDAWGLPAADIWGDFTAAVANNALRESELYDDVLVDGALSDGFEGRVAYLGTDYFRATSAAILTVESDDGEAMVSGPDGWGASIPVADGDIIGVTGLTDRDAHYRLLLGPPTPADTGDTGDTDHTDDTGPGGRDTDDTTAPADTDAPPDTATPPGDSAAPDTDAGVERRPDTSSDGSKGCALSAPAGSGVPLAALPILLTALVLRRKRSR